MIEMKQLQFFVVCAELKSFSRAAETLYTTQPNVSKVIRSLEEELGFELFIRKNRGIEMTARGRHVYDYARRVVDNIRQLSNFARMDKGDELLVSANPSSWMAATFAEFYNANKNQDVCFHMMTASTEDVIGRMAEGKDDIGFVYVMESQLPDFRYRLERNGLEYASLKRVEAMLYLGGKHSKTGAASIREVPTQGIRLVQCYEDEFTLDRYWDLFTQDREKQPDMKVAVVTNSDYVMNEMLQNTDLGNISSAYLSHEEKALDHHGIPLYDGEKLVHFGCIRRKDEDLSRWARKYLDFVKACLVLDEQ